MNATVYLIILYHWTFIFFLFSLLELNVLITGEIETLEQFLQIVLFNFFLYIKIIAFSYIMVLYIKYTFQTVSLCSPVQSHTPSVPSLASSSVSQVQVLQACTIILPEVFLFIPNFCWFCYMILILLMIFSSQNYEFRWCIKMPILPICSTSETQFLSKCRQFLTEMNKICLIYIVTKRFLE